MTLLRDLSLIHFTSHCHTSEVTAAHTAEVTAGHCHTSTYKNIGDGEALSQVPARRWRGVPEVTVVMG